MNVEIGPSLLAADQLNLERELGSIRTADFVHVDVFDDQFVRGASWGPAGVARIAEASLVEVDVHLMVKDVEWWVRRVAGLGVDRVFFHAEVTDDPARIARLIREAGAAPGIAFAPDTCLEHFCRVGDEVSQAIVMTVEPGQGGQKMLAQSAERIRETARMFPRMQLTADGGVTPENIGELAIAGAQRFVAGTSVFGEPNRGERIRCLRERATASSKSEAG